MNLRERWRAAQEIAQLRQQLEEQWATEHSLRMQLRLARAERDARTQPVCRVPAQRRRRVR